MKKNLTKSIRIKAPKEKVWSVLLEDTTYRQWAGAFYPGSYAKTDNWKEDSKVYFLSPEGDGMVSRIAIHKPSEIISFEHIGMIKEGREYFSDPQIKEWQGFKETYQVSQLGEYTQLSIEQDITEEYFDSFSEMWDRALESIKELAEA